MSSAADLPVSPLALRAIGVVRARESEPVANHSFRTYLFAALLAEHEGLRAGVDFDLELLFLACTLHDLGTSTSAEGKQRFEVEGADMAAAFLTDNGVKSAEVDQVWEAIALHTSPGIAERRGVLAYLTRKGVGMDFGVDTECVTDLQADVIHERFPRLRMVSSLFEEIVRHARRAPQNAPRYSVPGELLRERGANDTPTEAELTAVHSRWGE